MDKANTYKDLIEEILIRGKRYRDPDFSARKLAEALGVSSFQLSRIIKATYGISYADIVL